MGTVSTSLAIFLCLSAAALVGMLLRRVLPEHHLHADTKDSVKVAMGLVATMAALVLGLLIAAAKDKYDKESAGVTEMAAKAIFLDRMLANYGPEANDARGVFKRSIEHTRGRMWPGQAASAAQLDPTASSGELLYQAIQKRTQQNGSQTTLKSQAISAAFDLGQMRWQEFEQASSAISTPLLSILTFWLAILFISFGMFAPSNSTVFVALMMAGLTVAIAIFLLMELNSPFSGILQVSSAPFDDALAHLGQ